MYNNLHTHRTHLGTCMNRPYGEREIYSGFIIPPYVY